MHTEKIKIFDDYAKEQGFTDMMHFVSSSLLDSAQLCNHIFEACDLVQKAQQDRIAGNAVIEPNGMMTKVDKSSITSENNLIK